MKPEGLRACRAMCLLCGGKPGCFISTYICAPIFSFFDLVEFEPAF